MNTSVLTFSPVTDGVGPNPSVATVKTAGRTLGWMRQDGTFTPAHTDAAKYSGAIAGAFREAQGR